MEKLTITKLFRSNKDKSGKALVTSDGRPYERVAIKTQEYGDKWLSGFGNRGNAMWQIGDEVEVKVEKVQKNGNEYINFSAPNMWDEIKTIKKRLDALEGKDDGGFAESQGGKLDDEVPDEAFVEDMPF